MGREVSVLSEGKVDLPEDIRGGWHGPVRTLRPTIEPSSGKVSSIQENSPFGSSRSPHATVAL